jgi:hypothetical protein
MRRPERRGQGVFEYDAKAPLDVGETDNWNDGDVTVHELMYASPKGGRVSALVLEPPVAGPFADAAAWLAHEIATSPEHTACAVTGS